jgi:hypothetical protein
VYLSCDATDNGDILNRSVIFAEAPFFNNVSEIHTFPIEIDLNNGINLINMAGHPFSYHVRKVIHR